MKPHLQHIQQKLKERKSKNALRELKINENLVDFCSNDYLGLASEKSIHQAESELTQFGATGSRLISGNHQITEDVEHFLAEHYKAATALIFNSGYNANLGFFSCVPQRGDTIVYDELIHASIRDGIKLSNANSFSFQHNSLLALAEKIILNAPAQLRALTQTPSSSVEYYIDRVQVDKMTRHALMPPAYLRQPAHASLMIMCFYLVLDKEQHPPPA